VTCNTQYTRTRTRRRNGAHYFYEKLFWYWLKVVYTFHVAILLSRFIVCGLSIIIYVVSISEWRNISPNNRINPYSFSLVVGLEVSFFYNVHIQTMSRILSEIMSERERAHLPSFFLLTIVTTELDKTTFTLYIFYFGIFCNYSDREFRN